MLTSDSDVDGRLVNGLLGTAKQIKFKNIKLVLFM